MSQRDEDLALLRRLVYWGEEQDPEPGWVGPFERMILNLESEKWPSLTERQTGLGKRRDGTRLR